MRRLVFIAVLAVSAALLSSFASESAYSQGRSSKEESPGEFNRKIFVPFESLDVLLDGNSNRVLLSKAEYETLLESARTQKIKRAPLDSAIVSAKYAGVVEGGVALIKGELIVEPLNKGLVQIPLPFTGVAIRTAMLGKQPANLWRNEKGEIVLLTSGESRETLTLEMTVPMQTSAARQSMSIQLPSPSATQFSLTVPGNVEVKSGVPVASRQYNEDDDTTEFDLLADRGPMNIVMSLNNKLLKDEQVAVSRSVTIHKLSAHAQELHVTCSMNVIHGALEEVQFSVPEGYKVSQVATELLSQWEIIDPPKGGDTGKRLVVKLRQPTREDFVLSITATRNTGAVGQWKSEDIRPIDVAGHVSVIGVLADIELKSAKLVSDGVIPIDHEFLMAAIPETLQSANAENATAIVAAYYAPQKDYSIAANFSVPAPELIVKSNSRLVIDNQMLELQGGISLVSRHDSRFGFKLQLPDQWRLNEVTGLDGGEIRFDRVGVDGSSEFLVHLPARIPSASATKVFYRASLTPEGWLEKWEANEIKFPAVVIEGETKHKGAIAISTTEDLAIKPAVVSGLELLDDADKKKFELDRNNAPLAYQFETSEYELNLELERLKPSVVVRSYNYVTIKPTQMLVHAELVYDIKQASEGEFQFELPLESPKSISIRSTKQALKDYRSEETETARRWTVELAKPKKGNVHLLIDYQSPMKESDLAEMAITPVVAREVSFQSTMVAIEGSSELDIEIETEGRAIDVGEFRDSVYQPGRYLLGAYSWPNENLSLTVKSLRRPVYQLPSAIVQRAEMVTSISNNGKSQTAARFQLLAKQQSFLRVDLPKGATLWSVQLDGQSAKPQRQNDELFISLIGNETGKLRDLQLVFETPADSFRLVGKVQAHAPSLWLNESGDEDGTPVPLVDLHWRLIMPDGFSVSHSDGKFQSDQLFKRPSPIQQLGYWVYQLGGGVSSWYGIKQHRDASASVEQVEPYEFDKRHPHIALPEDAVSEMADGGKSLEPGRAQGSDDPFKDSGGSGEKKPASLWALSGLGSLSIELTDTGNAIEFYNLGEQPILAATVVNHWRLNWIAIALALLIAAAGVLLTGRRLRSKVLFVILVLLIACLIPLAGASVDAFRTIVDLAILAAVVVGIYFVLAALCRLLVRSLSLVAARIPLMMLLIAFTIGFCNQSHAQQVVRDADQLKRLIVELQSEPEVKLPNDAIIIPFDTDDPDGREKADRLLLPYEHYLKLINKAKVEGQPDGINAPVDFVLSSAQYNVQLTLEEDIEIEGKLVIEVLTDDPVSVTLPLMGGALADAKVDGEPAKLQFQPAGRFHDRKQQSQKKQSPRQRTRGTSSSLVQLHLEGRGSKTFEFNVRIKPARQGGWRMLSARLPVGMTRGLNLKSLNEKTEVRLDMDSDRRSIEANPRQEIATVLSSDGSLRLQWKPSTAAQTVDQSLTANSEAIFDVREDGLRLTWRVDLDFRGAERSVFTLNLPDGFLVEQVSGENVRAWDIKQDGKSAQLNVTTLSEAKDKESFTIEMSRRDFAVSETARQFDAPYLTVEGAALHKGVYTIRKSPIIELKKTRQQAASRIDENQAECRVDLASIDSKSSPLGIESFQVLQFVTTPFQIGLDAKLVSQSIKAETQMILRLGQSEANLEMKIKVNVGQRPIYKMSMDLPKDIEIRELAAGLQETWTTETIGNAKRVQFFFPKGVSSDFSIVLDAELTEYSGAAQWSIPKVRINDVQQQTGFIAVQADPALAVTSRNLKDCETVLLQQLGGWLNRSQRSATRMALRTKGADYDATLQFTKIKPRVTVETVTNVRTTLFAIEETILLDFDIQQAGIRKVQFELPATMRNARVNAKLVSETIIEDIAADNDRIRVTLNLQDDVIGSFRVVVENDRQLSNARQDVPVPRVITGVTEQRYVTLQNAGRDEINIIPSQGFQVLNRQLNQFARLKQKLAGGEVTMAYVADVKNQSPVLQFENKQREVFDTVAASIEFSKTTMVVDSSGAYRALQNFQVNNRSEQYLEIELPAGARLLTVLVEGQPVKPVAWPGAKNQRRLRIPLVKTQLGDLDYPVQLKYAGRLGTLSGFNEIEFPVVETLNINVQLSQLHLRLPDSYRWLNFGGTMTKVDDRGKLEESYLSYKGRQIQQLAEQIQNQSSRYSSFASKRAYSNLKRLQKDMDDYEASDRRRSRELPQSGQVRDLVKGNSGAIEQLKELYREQAKSSEVIVDNRANFNGLIEDQSAMIGRNSINKQDLNFRYELENPGKDQQQRSPENAARSKINGNSSFDGKWLSRNQLSGVQLFDGQQQSGSATESREKWKSENGQGQYGESGINDKLGWGSNLAIVTNNERPVDDSIGFTNPNSQRKKFENLELQSSKKEMEYAQEATGKLSRDKGFAGLDKALLPAGGYDEDISGFGLGGGGFGGGGGRFDDDRNRWYDEKKKLANEYDRKQVGNRSGQRAGDDSVVVGGVALDGITAGPSLTSLDIELPARGTDYFFKSPRGKATVVVRPLRSRTFSRWASLAITIGVCLGAWMLGWLLMRLWRSSTLRVIATLGLLLGGLISVASMILPVYGLIAIIGSIVLFIDWIIPPIVREESAELT